ncbi:MAG TPA: hypothetical protein VFM28_10090 [Nitrososphaeraceae archaeon]|jgi:hypothetical protein|nr:hypothetical protein [Nitrososphaeraceae archaeon]
MDYKNIGKDILYLDPNIRFVTIFDTTDGLILFSEHRPGVTNLLTAEQSKHSIQFSVSAWKIRSTLEKKIGKGKFVLAEYEKIKRITMPLDKNHLLYITTEVGCDALSLIDKIKKIIDYDK